MQRIVDHLIYLFRNDCNDCLIVDRGRWEAVGLTDRPGTVEETCTAE
ncbi:hypothetical protein [Pseudozobellia sp. WGM2]|nr:hypothetical protein [Pseudozobellia sp. WGM2]